MEHFKSTIAGFRQEIQSEQTLVKSLKEKMDLFEDPLKFKKWIISQIESSAQQSKYQWEALVSKILGILSFFPFETFQILDSDSNFCIRLMT